MQDPTRLPGDAQPRVEREAPPAPPRPRPPLGPALAVATVASAAVAVCRRQAERGRHRSQTEQTWEQGQTKILIVGGGFGGSATALALDRKLRHDVDASVLMIDRGNAQLFVPLLWTVAEGRANAENVMVPLRS